MPRSYSFDHYQVPKKDTNLIHDQEKKEYTESRPPAGEPKIHYGKKFAKTEELATVRKMNAELEELAGLDEELDEELLEAEAEDDAPVEELDFEARAEELKQGSPIGALPAAAPDPLQPVSLRDVWDSVRGNTRLVRLAVRDLAAASLRLARLPVQVASLAARRFRPLTG